MKKRHSVGRFVVVAILTLVVLLLTVCSFKLPGNWKDNDFVGFARAINYGIDFKGGTLQEYSVKSKVAGSKVADGISYNVSRIGYLLQNEGYDVNVFANGDNISVEFWDEYQPLDISEIINKKVTFSIKKENGADKEEIVTANDIESAQGLVSGSQNVLILYFTDIGAEHFQTIIESGTAYFYINSTSPQSVDVSNASNQYIGITVGSLDTAKYYASEIMSAKYNLSFDNISTTTVTKGEAQKNVIVAICLTLGLFLLCSILLIAFFKKLGLVGSFILLIGTLLQILILQAIPESVFVMTVPAFYASLLTMILGALTIFLIFAKMHSEYKQGKILFASVKFGYNKVWAKILDYFVILFAIALVALFVASYYTKQFAMALVVGLAVFAVVVLVLTKFFTIWLSNICYKNKDYGFKREAHINELK